MKIGIISDTHKKVKKAKKAIAKLLEDGAEFIIHSGDIVEVEILKVLKYCSVDYIAVYGNNDAHLIEHHQFFNLVQEPHYFLLDNLKFKLMHLPYFMTPDADVVVYGHTHQFVSEYTKDTLYINSGEVCARKKPISEFAMLETFEDKYIITHYEKYEKESGYKTTTIEHKREVNE